MDMPELALQEAALKTLADRVAEEMKAVKAAMQAELESSGASQVPAVLPDGTKVGTASLTVPKAAAQVVDGEAFMEWVRDTAPSEITSRVVTEVRPAFRAALLAQMTAAGAAEVPDRATGEIAEVPGVEVRAGRATTHSMRLTKDGADRIIAAWQSGALARVDLPQLTGGDAS